MGRGGGEGGGKGEGEIMGGGKDGENKHRRKHQGLSKIQAISKESSNERNQQTAFD